MVVISKKVSNYAELFIFVSERMSTSLVNSTTSLANCIADFRSVFIFQLPAINGSLSKKRIYE